MTVSIVLAAVIACLVTALIFTAKGNLNLQREVEDANRQLHHTNMELVHLQAMYIEAVQTSAWLRGLRIGCEPTKLDPEDLRVPCDIKEDKQI